MIFYRITKELPLHDALALYREAGWISDTDAAPYLKDMLANSFAVSAAFDDAEGGRLVGMMRAFSDGVSDAYLLDLVVAKSHRKLGVGRMVLEKLVEHVRSFGVDWTVCVGAPGTETFYSRTSGVKMEDFTPFRFD